MERKQVGGSGESRGHSGAVVAAFPRGSPAWAPAAFSPRVQLAESVPALTAGLHFPPFTPGSFSLCQSDRFLPFP